MPAKTPGELLIESFWPNVVVSDCRFAVHKINGLLASYRPKVSGNILRLHLVP
ncbi:hypothetical protein RSSM_02956 [Rhodopirellula sallentina SM41]|uniref:Uncharacterized protein n=1 Tax=Rhodopirellula sallentina SM41 TaxID=1263870 RepID=M5U2D0_9BACT|nr:hypothetical protein RSSM_02956 [Rhodopirellula sallentina SM41]